MEYQYYHYYCFVIIGHNNAASSEYIFSAMLFFLPFKETQCRDIKRKMLEFPRESSNLLVHSVVPCLLRVSTNLTVSGVLYCLLIIRLRNACLIFSGLST